MKANYVWPKALATTLPVVASPTVASPTVTSLLVALLIAVSLITMPAFALNPGEAAEKARAQTGGKVLQVKAVNDNTYRVKVLMPNGQVRSLMISDKKKVAIQKSR